MFLNPSIFSNLNSNCYNLLDMRNLQEQVKKDSITQNCSDLSLFKWIVLVIEKIIANSWPSASNFNSSLEHFFFSQYGRTILETKYHFFECNLGSTHMFKEKNYGNYLCSRVYSRKRKWPLIIFFAPFLFSVAVLA